MINEPSFRDKISFSFTVQLKIHEQVVKKIFFIKWSQHDTLIIIIIIEKCGTHYEQGFQRTKIFVRIWQKKMSQKNSARTISFVAAVEFSALCKTFRTCFQANIWRKKAKLVCFPEQTKCEILGEKIIFAKNAKFLRNDFPLFTGNPNCEVKFNLFS